MIGSLKMPSKLGAKMSNSSFNTPTIRFWLNMVLRCCALVALIGLIVGCGYIPYGTAKPISAHDGSTSYVGHCRHSVCSWYGIRYAAPPVGDLRFAPPQQASNPGSIVQTNTKGPRCPQSGSINQQDEDCLFLNIQRPRHSSLDSKLPVLVFFHGGGFETGSGNDNDPTAFINIASASRLPIVVVRINYRLGLLGFLASQEMESERDSNPNNIGLNRGFQDMKMATEWVKDHISAFGGDPQRITIWGQSAGSFGASAQLLGHPTSAPFQAAILQSGSPGGVPIDPPSAKNAQYQRVLVSAQCDTSTDHLSCLRALSWQAIRSISLAESTAAQQPGTYLRGFYAWTGTIDGGPEKGGFFSSSPSTVIDSGFFARIPVLQGDCLDEGTYFAPHTFSDTATLSNWLSSVYFTRPGMNSSTSNAALTQALDAYPDEPSLGSPYQSNGASSSNRFFGSTNQFKRAASIYGDIRFQSDRRFWLSALTSKNVKAYSFLYAQQDPTVSSSLGVPHGSDLSAVLQAPANPISMTMAQQFLSFATNLDPSASNGLPVWPVYTAASPTMLQYSDGSITQISDTYRADAINVLNTKEILQITGR